MSPFLSDDPVATKGSYILLAELVTPVRIQVGRLGSFDFKEGIYAYCGSALNGLESRLRRHFSTDKKLRWHIDYLMERAEVIEALVVPSPVRLECVLNRIVGNLDGSSMPVEGFGSSDCGCRSHLHLISEKDLSDLKAIFGDLTVSPSDLLC